jgi:hypothetical protein
LHSWRNHSTFHCRTRQIYQDRTDWKFTGTGPDIMDQDSLDALSQLLHTQRIGALGTLHNGSPFVSMVLTVAEPEGAGFLILASRLAWHTRDMANDPRVGLMLVEKESSERDPQTLARLSIMGEVKSIGLSDSSYPAAKDLYLQTFPSAETLFQLGDFSLYRIIPTGGRFVGGFARAFAVSPEDLRQAMRNS